MVTTITNSGLANSSTIEPKETTVVVSGFGTGRTKDSKDKFTANGINNLKIVDSANKIKQNGFSSFKVVPAIGTGSFDERFNVAFDGVSSTVTDALASVQQDANNIKSTVLNMSNNLTTNYLSKAELTSYDNIINITSAIKEQTATFVTAEQAGGWYGLTLESDVKGKKYITGFDIGSIVYPESGINDSYFRINADRFIVGGDIGDGEFGGPLDENGEPIPAFSIVQDGIGNPQMYFNGKVKISSMPEAVTKLLGKFAHISELNSYLAVHPEVIVRDGDTYLNTTQNIVYFWDGDEWISVGDEVKFQSTVFIRSETKPSAPTGGTYNSSLPTSTPEWSDGVPNGTGPLWYSVFTFSNKVDYTTNTAVWSGPEPLALSENTRFLFSGNPIQVPDPVGWTDHGNGTYGDTLGNWATPVVDPYWMAISESKIIDGNVVWGAWVVSKVKGEDGQDGTSPVLGVDYFIDGSKYQATLYKEVVNGTNPSSVALPIGTSFNGTNNVSSTNGWTDDPVVSDANGKYLVLSTGLFSQSASTGSWSLSGTWSTPQKYTIEKGVDFFDGAAGTYTSYIYKVGAAVAAPAGGSFAGNVSTEVMPSGWVDNPSYGIDDVVWVSSVVYQQSAAGSTSWVKIGNWTTPTRFYVRGYPGTPGINGANGATGANGARGSGIRSGSATTASGFFSAFNYSMIDGDQYVSTSSAGTEIYTYSSSSNSWSIRNTLQITGNAVVSGTLYANRIAAGHIGTAISAIATTEITAISTFASAPSYSTYTTIGGLTYYNGSNTSVNILVSATGRTGITSGDGSGAVHMAIYSGGVLISDYGWTPANQDSKALSGVATIGAYGSAYVALKGAKTATTVSHVGTNMRISIIGIAYGS